MSPEILVKDYIEKQAKALVNELNNLVFFTLVMHQATAPLARHRTGASRKYFPVPEITDKKKNVLVKLSFLATLIEKSLMNLIYVITLAQAKSRHRCILLYTDSRSRHVKMDKNSPFYAFDLLLAKNFRPDLEKFGVHP